MNQNKMKKAISCSLAFITPASSVLPMMINQSIMVSATEQKSGTGMDIYKNEAISMLTLFYNVIPQNYIKITSQKENIKTIFSNGLNTIKNATTVSQLSTSLDSIRNNLKTAWNNCEKIEFEGSSDFYNNLKFDIPSLYVGEADEVAGSYYNMKYLSAKAVVDTGDKLNLLNKSIVTGNNGQNFSGEDFEALNSPTNFTIPTVKSIGVINGTSGFPEKDDKGNIYIYPNLKPLLSDGTYSLANEYTTKNGNNITSHSLYLVRYHQNESTYLDIVKDLEVIYNASTNKTNVKQTYYYYYNGVLYKLIKNEDISGKTNHISLKGQIEEQLSLLETSYLDESKYYNENDFLTYYNSEKKTLTESKYGKEYQRNKQIIESLRTDFNKQLEEGTLTTSSITSSIENAKSKLNASKVKASVKSALASLSKEESLKRINAIKLSKVENSEVGENGDAGYYYDSNGALKSEISDKKSIISTSNNNDTICEAIMNLEDTLSKSKMKGTISFETYRDLILDNDFDINRILAMIEEPNISDNYSEDDKADMAFKLQKVKNSIKGKTITTEELLRTFKNSELKTTYTCYCGAINSDTWSTDVCEVCHEKAYPITEMIFHYYDPSEIVNTKENEIVNVLDALSKDFYQSYIPSKTTNEAQLKAIEELRAYAKKLIDSNKYSTIGIGNIEALRDEGIIKLSTASSELITKLVKEYKSYLDKVKTIDDENNQENSEKLAVEKLKASEIISNYVDFTKYSSENQIKLRKIINNTVEKINQQSTVNGINTVLEEGKASCDLIPEKKPTPTPPPEDEMIQIRKEAKQNLKEYLNTISTNYTADGRKELEKIFNNYCTKIDTAENRDEVEDYISLCKEEMKKVSNESQEISQQLEAAIENAKITVSRYVDKDNYYESEKQEIDLTIDFYHDKLSKAPSLKEVNHIVDKAKDSLDNIKNKIAIDAEKEAYKQQINQYKQECINTLDSFDLDIYRPFEQDKLIQIINNTKTELNKNDTNTTEKIQLIMNEVTYKKAGLKTALQYSKEEALSATDFLKMKTSAIQTLDSIDRSAYRLAEKVIANNLINEGKIQINEAKLPSEIDNILKTVKGNISDLKTDAQYREEESATGTNPGQIVIEKDGDSGIDKNNAYYLYLNESNKAIKNDKLVASDTEMVSSNRIRVSTVKYTFESGIQKIVRTLYDDDLGRKLVTIYVIENEVTVASRIVSVDSSNESVDLEIDPDVLDYNDAIIIAETRLNYLDLSVYRTKEQTEVKILIKDTFDELKKYHTKAEVQKVMENFEFALNKIPTDATLSKEDSDEVTLAKAKLEATANLEAMIEETKYRQEELDEILDIVVVAKAMIVQATSIDDLQPILNEVKNKISTIKTDEEYKSEEDKAKEDNLQKEKDLLTQKEAALKQIKELVKGKEYRETQAKEVQKILDDYNSKILSSKDEVELDALVKEATKALNAIKTNSELLETEKKDATQTDKVGLNSEDKNFAGKADGNSSSSDGTAEQVKTSDTNNLIGFGVLAGIGALFTGIYVKFKRKK